jgi:DNA-directed RNA polymerase subunit RPC12/RpoP
MNDYKMINDDDYLKIEPVDDAPTETTISNELVKEKPEPLNEYVEKKPVRETIKYICSKCNYKFTRKASTSQALRCPYCSGSTIEEDTFDLDQTIREI